MEEEGANSFTPSSFERYSDMPEVRVRLISIKGCESGKEGILLLKGMLWLQRKSVQDSRVNFAFRMSHPVGTKPFNEYTSTATYDTWLQS